MRHKGEFTVKYDSKKFRFLYDRNGCTVQDEYRCRRTAVWVI